MAAHTGVIVNRGSDGRLVGLLQRKKTGLQRNCREITVTDFPQKAAMIIERLTYDEIDQRHDIKIFTDNQTEQDVPRAT